jgi:hypothetical protein
VLSFFLNPAKNEPKENSQEFSQVKVAITVMNTNIVRPRRAYGSFILMLHETAGSVDSFGLQFRILGNSVLSERAVGRIRSKHHVDVNKISLQQTRDSILPMWKVI